MIQYGYPFFWGLAWGVSLAIYYGHIGPYNELRPRLWHLLLFFISAFLGAKIVFLFAYPHPLPMTIWFSHLTSFSGGLVFYGGMISGSFYLLLSRVPVHWERIPLSLSLGHGLGRIGCYCAGCCYGDFFGLISVQLVESGFLLMMALFFYVNKRQKYHLGIYAICYSVFRFIIEFFRDDSIRGHFLFLSTSQWISVVLLLVGGGLLIRPLSLHHLRERKEEI